MEKMFMIALTPTMENGKIVKWLKKENDTIARGDVLCEVETDKSSMEYESLNEGTILKILAPEGGSAKIGDTIALVGKPGEDISSAVAEFESAADAEVKKEAEKSSEKTPEKPPVQPTKQKTQEVNTAPAPVQSPAGGRVNASPLARKIAENRGIDINSVRGSGPNGRILKRDVENAPASETSAVSAPSSRAVFAEIPADGTDTEISVKGMRGVIAQRLSESKFSAPHFYVKVTLSTDAVVGLRNSLNDTLQKQKKAKLSMNAFFIKLVSEALKRNPGVNSSWQGTKIVQFGSVDIGLAVDLGAGLMTPVVRNCTRKGIEHIDADLQTLIEKMRSRSIAPQEYTGATFTISNLGSFGVDEFTAIINPPGAAILAVGRNRQEPVVKKDGSIGTGNVMTLTLSCDHRVIDGAVAAKFISDLKNIFENPALALL